MNEIYKPKHWLTWLAVIPLGLSLIFGAPYVKRAGNFIGHQYYKRNKKRRSIALKNIALCFKEQTPQQHDQLCREFFNRFGQSFINLGRIWWGSKKSVNALIECPRFDILTQLQKEGRTVIFQVPHTVAVDVGGIYLSQHIPNLFSFSKKLDNPVMEHFTTKGRSRFGGQMYERQQGMREILKNLKSGRWFYLVADEDLGAKSAEFIPFFGSSKATLTTTISLARSVNAVIVPCATQFELNSYKYIIHIGDPYEISKDMGNTEALKKFNQKAEEMVNIDPTQFLWILRWFKTAPDGSKNTLYD